MRVPEKESQPIPPTQQLSGSALSPRPVLRGYAKETGPERFATPFRPGSSATVGNSRSHVWCSSLAEESRNAVGDPAILPGQARQLLPNARTGLGLGHVAETRGVLAVVNDAVRFGPGNRFRTHPK